MIKIALSAAAITLVTTGGAISGAPQSLAPTQTIYSKNNTTRAFVGLNFAFGAGGVTPEGVLGVAHGTTNASNDFTGIKGSLHFDLENNFGLRSGKLTGLAGERDFQGELGLGYNFGEQTIFGVAGVNGEHFQAGADIGLDGQLEGYLGIHSLDAFDPRTEETVPLKSF